MKHHAYVVLLFSVACGGGQTPATQPSPPPVDPVTPPAPPVERPAPPPALGPEVAYLAECRDAQAKAKDQIAKLTAVSGPRTVANTLEPFGEMWRLVLNAQEKAGLYHEVHPDAKLRDAARTCEAELDSYTSSVMLDRGVYDALVAVDVSKEDVDTKRFHAHQIRNYKRAGVALPDAQRARVKEIDDESTKLGQQFSKNIAEDTRYIEVTDAKRLAGMPADWIAAHPADAKGTIKISTDYPDYTPFMTYAADDELRKQLYVKFLSRGDAHNEEVLQKLLALRAERAKLLGFPNWADFQSDDKMLRGAKNAAAFIERVTKLAKPRGAKDYAELLATLRKTDPKAKAVAAWQKFLVENEVKKTKYAVDSTEVRNYFPFAQTLAGLLSITSKIYDIQYKKVTDAAVWHPTVEVYDVMRGTTKLGRIYLDLHPRADKYKHAAQFSIVDGIHGKQLPEGALVCNFPQPGPSNPGLMDHGDVVTMFHEFGHLMHHVLGGDHRWITQSGVATERDFVEAPSQMFEEWGWSYETLSQFAKHHQTGEVIPKDLVDRMRKSRAFGLGTWTLQQMFYAAISLEFHRADPAKLDQLATVKKLQRQYTPFEFVDGTKQHTSFGHLYGYSSMYYTYMWSLVIAKDLLSRFDKTGLLDTKETYRYRDKVLAPGGTKDAADLVADFLGRPYNFKAFEKFLSQ